MRKCVYANIVSYRYKDVVIVFNVSAKAVYKATKYTCVVFILVRTIVFRLKTSFQAKNHFHMPDVTLAYFSFFPSIYCDQSIVTNFSFWYSLLSMHCNCAGNFIFVITIRRCFSFLH